jgi:hypothetical protein
MVLLSATPLVPDAGTMDATENGVVDVGVDGVVGGARVELPQPERKATSAASVSVLRFNLVKTLCIGAPKAHVHLDATQFCASCSAQGIQQAAVDRGNAFRVTASLHSTRAVVSSCENESGDLEDLLQSSSGEYGQARGPSRREAQERIAHSPKTAGSCVGDGLCLWRAVFAYGMPRPASTLGLVSCTASRLWQTAQSCVMLVPSAVT